MLHGFSSYSSLSRIKNNTVTITMNDILYSSLNAIHKRMARNILAVRLAILIRNQCKRTISCFLNDGIDPKMNGEEWLAKVAAPTSLVFIDVGANVGEWTEMYLSYMKRASKGLLFEPSSTGFKELKTRFEKLEEIEIVQAAVSDASGEMPFFEETEAGQTSSLVPGFSREGAAKKNVRTTTLDLEVEKRQIDHIDFLKIDAEGYDFHVIRGAKNLLTQHKIDFVQFEYNTPWKDVGSSLTDAYEFFESLNYKVFLLKKSGLYDINNPKVEDYYFYSNFVAIPAEKLANIDIAIKSIKIFSL